MRRHGDQRDKERDLPLAVVMGGAGGLGLATVRRLGQNHAVIIADLDGARSEALADELHVEGYVVEAIPCDVTSAASVTELFRRVGERGPLRTLANVVGLSPIAGDWRAIMSVNLTGAARALEAALPIFAPGGAAVLISSIAAHNAKPDAAMKAALERPLAKDFLQLASKSLGRDLTPLEAYQYSKYGLNRMCRRLASEWGRRGARIVSVSPGLIRTPMGEREFVNSPIKFDILAATPLPRQCSIMEVMDAVEFLVSDRASFITGTDLLVDGGYMGSVEPAPELEPQ